MPFEFSKYLWKCPHCGWDCETEICTCGHKVSEEWVKKNYTYSVDHGFGENMIYKYTHKFYANPNSNWTTEYTISTTPTPEDDSYQPINPFITIMKKKITEENG